MWNIKKTINLKLRQKFRSLSWDFNWTCNILINCYVYSVELIYNFILTIFFSITIFPSINNINLILNTPYISIPIRNYDDKLIAIKSSFNIIVNTFNLELWFDFKFHLYYYIIFTFSYYFIIIYCLKSDKKPIHSEQKALLFLS